MGSNNAEPDRMGIARADEAKDIALPLLARVIEMGGHNWADICAKIDAKHCQLWIITADKPIAALVTQCTIDDELEILLAGGEQAASWVGIAEHKLKAFARENGLHLLRIWGRVGWVRLLPHWSIKGKEQGLVIIEVAI